MHVTTQKTVSIDDVELGDMIMNHLREKGLLPDGQKVSTIVVSGAMDVGLKTKLPDGVPLEKPIRIIVKWYPKDAE